MPTNIPKARALLRIAYRKAQEEGQREICDLIAEAGQLMTRSVRSQSRTMSRRITSEIVGDVLQLVAVSPNLMDMEIAERFGINPGRVNEIRNGLRTVEHPSISTDGLNVRRSRK